MPSLSRLLFNTISGRSIVRNRGSGKRPCSNSSDRCRSPNEKPVQGQDGSRVASQHRQERTCYHRAAIATGSTFAVLPSKRVSSAAASNPIRTILATCSRGRSAAKRAMNSPFRSVAHSNARFTMPTTSRPDGRRPPMIPSRSPIGFGNKPALMTRAIITTGAPLHARRAK